MDALDKLILAVIRRIGQEAADGDGRIVELVATAGDVAGVGGDHVADSHRGSVASGVS